MSSLISISSIVLFFHKNENLFKRGENSFTSGNVKEIIFDGRLKILRGTVDASMKDRSYKTEVDTLNMALISQIEMSHVILISDMV